MMDNRALDKIESALPTIKFCRDVLWSDISILGIGAPILIIAEPSNDIELRSLLKYCHVNKINVKVVGAGGNIIGSDKPFDGVIIRMIENDFSRIVPSHRHVTVGAGVKLCDFLKQCAKFSLGGASALVGIPGTIGGTLRMNAGACGLEMQDFVVELCGYKLDSSMWCIDAEDLNWDYRKVNIPEDVILTAAIFKLEKVDSTEELKNINNELARRAKESPTGRSVGCIFSNPTHEIFAGKLIDESNCKGERIGGAVVSDIHANYFLNDNNATEKNYVDLIIKVRQEVLNSSGILLPLEVHFLDSAMKELVNSSPKIPNIIVLKGGDSRERDISLQSGHGVEDALRIAGYNVTGIDIKKLKDWDSISIDKKNDIVFPILHGGFGENGDIQKLMERDGVRFIGCDSKASLLTLDKIESKRVMEKSGLPTPKFAIITKYETDIPAELALPLIIKPPLEGSTFGIALVTDISEWKSKIKESFKYSDTLLVEEYIEGAEITVGIVGDLVLPVIEIQFPGKIFDYDAKYEHLSGETRYLSPPESISVEIQEKAQKLSLQFAKALNARDLIRVDLMVDNSGEITIIEANNMPGFTPSSLLPKAAMALGLSFPQVCGMLVQMAAKR